MLHARTKITMTFPEGPYGNASAFATEYFGRVRHACDSVDLERLSAAIDILERCYGDGQSVFVCGNGGSAAISNHLVCDHVKGIQTNTHLSPRVTSLSSNIEIITAVANDISYDDVFAYQLKSTARAGDALITVSSSGDSENVVRAAKWARDNNLPVIAMTGFQGGRSRELATVSLHVDGDNYGIVEDVHQSLMHIFAQYIRQAHMTETTVNSTIF